MTIIRMLIVFLLFILLNIYLFVRGWQALPDKSAIHAIYTVLFLFVSTAVFIAIFAGNKLPIWLGQILEIVGGYWIILFIFILFAAFLGDMLRLLNHFFGIFPDWIINNYQQVKLLYFITVFAILGFISVIGYFHHANPKITEVSIQVDHGSRIDGNLNIIVVSDIHLGNLIRRERLAGWVNLVNKQKPDIILIAGDVFDHNMRTVEFQKMDTELSRFESKYGVYAIPGNHDYYAGIDKAMNYLKKSGIKVLRDQSVVIDERLVLIGRDDITNKKRLPLKSLMYGYNGDLPKIVLDHQPLSFAESVENNVDLHLSGHTHNGQIFPLNLIVSKIYELGYGYKKSGKTHYYVSSGLGLWGAPIRFGTRSEIVRIVLKGD